MRPWLFQWQVDGLGDLSVPAYFFMMTLAFLVATSLVIREARRNGKPVVDMLDLSLWAFGAGLVGSRLGHVFFESAFMTFTERWTVDTSTIGHVLCRWAEHPHGMGVEWNLGEYYLLHPHMVAAVWNGGVVYYGGVLLALPVAWWFCRRRNLSYWQAGDIAIPVLLVGLAFGRAGCVMAGCCYGEPATGWAEPLGLHFHTQVEPALQGLPLHPTQAYESMAALTMAGFLVLWRSRRRWYDGQVFVWGIVMYGIWRFLVEYLRADEARGVHFEGWIPAGLSTSQLISIGLISAALTLGYWLRRNRTPMFVREPEEPEEAEGAAEPVPAG